VKPFVFGQFISGLYRPRGGLMVPMAGHNKTQPALLVLTSDFAQDDLGVVRVRLVAMMRPPKLGPFFG
jgi:hypothetical protein